MDFNKDEKYIERNSKYHGYEFFEPNARLEVLKNNYNFFLNNDELKELLEEKASFGKNKGAKFKIYIKKDYEDFAYKIKEEVKKNTSLSLDSDALLLWANYSRVLEMTIGLENVIEDEKDYLKNRRTNYEIDTIKDYKEIKNIFENEFLLFDTETTGVSKLNQIIEFGGIIYNRRVFNDEFRIKEVLNSKFDNNSILSLIKYFNYDYLISDGFDLLEIYSKKISDEENKKIKYELLQEFSDKISDKGIKISKEKLNRRLLKIDNFNLYYNRKIHFYLNLYKDYVIDTTYEIHHLDNDLITSKGLSTEKVLEGLVKILDNQVLLAHNISFDITKISELFNDFKIKGPKIKKIYDTIGMFQLLNKELKIANKVFRYNLDYLSKLYLGINLNMQTENSADRHTAIFDVKLTYSNLKKAFILTTEYKNNLIIIDESKKNLEKIEKEIIIENKNIINGIQNINNEKKETLIKLFNNKIKKIKEISSNEFVYNIVKLLFEDYFSEIKKIEDGDSILLEIKDRIKKLKIIIYKYHDKIKRNTEIVNELLKNIGKEEKVKRKHKKDISAKNNLSLFL